MGQLLVAVLLLIAEVGAAQTVAASGTKPGVQPTHAATTPAQSNVPSVFELLRTRYRFENDGTGRKEVVAKIRILNQMGTRQRAEETFEYHPLSEDLQIRYVRVRKKDGTVVNVEADLVQRPQTVVAPEYDLDEKRVRIPGLVVGDSVEYDVVTVFRRPIAPGQFFLQHSFNPGVANEQLEINIPRDRTVKVKGIPSLKTWETADDRRNVYHWENRIPESRPVGIIPYVPGRTPDVQVSSFLSWEEVGSWYSPETPIPASSRHRGFDDLQS